MVGRMGLLMVCLICCIKNQVMKNLTLILLCSHDFKIGIWSGIVSGLLISLFIWGFRYLTKNFKFIHVKYPVDGDIEKIELINWGLYDIRELSIRCRVSFTNFVPNHLLKTVK